MTEHYVTKVINEGQELGPGIIHNDLASAKATIAFYLGGAAAEAVKSFLSNDGFFAAMGEFHESPVEAFDNWSKTIHGIEYKIFKVVYKV